MQQRTYHGNVSADQLADFLVDRYSSQKGVQAQKLGENGNLLVQIGYGEHPGEMRHAITIAIAADPEAESLVVTMGQRQWITPEETKHAAFWGLLAILITPWVLFALLWPLSELISSSTLPDDIWSSLETYLTSYGVTVGSGSILEHPHIA